MLYIRFRLGAIYSRNPVVDALACIEGVSVVILLIIFWVLPNNFPLCHVLLNISLFLANIAHLGLYRLLFSKLLPAVSQSELE